MVDNKKTLKCPACGIEMTKIFIPEQNINLDICVNGCGGIYFDNRELERFSNSETNITEITNALSAKTFDAPNENKTRICPVCGANMVKNFASGHRNIQIDECYSCGGKFLDYDELQKIRAEEKISTVETIKQAVGKGINNATNSDLQSLFDSLFQDA